MHVPVSGGSGSGPSGLLALLAVLGAMLAWQAWGWWLLLAPAVLVVFVGLIVSTIVVRERRAEVRQISTPSGEVATLRLGCVPVEECVGCHWRTAQGVLTVRGQRIPVCPVCERVAVKRLIDGRALMQRGSR